MRKCRIWRKSGFPPASPAIRNTIPFRKSAGAFRSSGGPRGSPARRGKAEADRVGAPSRLGLLTPRLALLAVPLVAAWACAPRLTLEQYELPKHVGLMALGAMIAVAAPGWLALRRWGAFPPLIGLFAAVLFSSLLSPAPAISLAGDSENIAGLLTWMLYASLFLAASSADGGLRARLHAAVLFAAAVSAAFALMQQAGFDPLRGEYFHHVHAFAGNPDFLAQQMAMALPLALGAAIGRRSLGAAGLAALLLVVAALTASRAGMLGALAGAGLLLWWLRESWRPWRGAVLKAGIPAVILLMAAAEFAVPPDLSLRARLNTFLSEGAFAGTRGFLWGGVIRVIRDNPVAGCGTDALKTPFLKYAPPGWASREGLGISARNAHNEPLHLWATVGALGLGAYLWLLAAAARTARLRLSRPGVAAPAAAVAAYLVQNLFSFGTAATSPVFWLLLGSLAAPPGTSGGETRPGPVSRAVPEAFLVALALFAFLRLAADGFAYRGNEASRAGRPDLAAPYFALAHAAAPWSATYAIREAGALEERGRLEEALPLFESAAAQDPRSGILLGNVGRVSFALATAGKSREKQEEALAVLLRAVELAPTQPTLLGAVIMAYQQMGRMAERDEYARKLWTADPGWAARMLASPPPR